MGKELAVIKGSAPATVATLRQYLEQKSDNIGAVCASMLDPNRLTQVVIRSVAMNPKLQECSIITVYRSVLMAAELGLCIGGALGEAYLVPFGGVCQMIPGFRGLSGLAYRSGLVDDVSVRAVYKDDEFTVELGSEERIVHKPAFKGSRRDEDAILFYCVVRLKGSNHTHFDYMTVEEINAIRNNSPAYKYQKDTPWKSHWAEMAKKTVLKRTLKITPMSVEMAQAVALDNAVQTGDYTDVHFNCIDDEDLPMIAAAPDRSGTANVEAARAAKQAKAEPKSSESAERSEADPALLVFAPPSMLNDYTAACKAKGVGETKTCMDVAGVEPQNATVGQMNMLMAFLEALP